MTSTSSFFVVRIIFSLWHWIAGQFSLAKGFPGTWAYQCVTADPKMFFPGTETNAHGGTCTVKVKYTSYGVRVSVRGRRTWEGVVQNGGITKNNLPQAMEWNSLDGAFINHDTVMYTYSIHHEPVKGITFLTLEYDKNHKLLKPSGRFYYYPSDIPQQDTYKTMVNRSIFSEFGKVSGQTTFTEHTE